jgi:ATP-dependent Clp protease ATP-binding subunit ClpC
LIYYWYKYRGEFEERLKRIVEEAQNDSAVIIVIDEIHTLVGAGAAEGAVDAANILKPALARGKFRVLERLQMMSTGNILREILL